MVVSLGLEQRSPKQQSQHVFVRAAGLAADLFAIDDVDERRHHADAILLGQLLVVPHVNRVDAESFITQRGDRRLDMVAAASRRRSEIKHLAGSRRRIDLQHFLKVVVTNGEKNAHRQCEGQKRKHENTIVHDNRCRCECN